jgi:hypothetical protein
LDLFPGVLTIGIHPKNLGFMRVPGVLQRRQINSKNIIDMNIIDTLDGAKHRRGFEVYQLEAVTLEPVEHRTSAS